MQSQINKPLLGIAARSVHIVGLDAMQDRACTQIKSGVAEGGCLLQAVLHPDAHEEGGLAFNNRELLESQRSAIYELVRDVSPSLQ